jgi:hypothetical protein
MNNISKNIWLFMLLSAGAFFSCEDNDPLSEMGNVTTEKVPFVTISGMRSLYPAGDSILYNTFYWGINDDIDKLALLRGEQVIVKGSLTVNDGAGDVTVQIDELFEAEIEQEGADLQHDELDFETARNAYNKPLLYEVPSKYQLYKIEEADEEAYAKVSELAYSDEIKTAILQELANNGVVVTWDGLADITEAVNLQIESTLSFQVRVFNKKGFYNDSPVRNVKIGGLKE